MYEGKNDKNKIIAIIKEKSVYIIKINIINIYVIVGIIK